MLTHEKMIYCLLIVKIRRDNIQSSKNVSEFSLPPVGLIETRVNNWCIQIASPI